MLIRVFIVCILASYTVVNLQAQSNWIEWKEDVSEAEENEWMARTIRIFE